MRIIILKLLLFLVFLCPTVLGFSQISKYKEHRAPNSRLVSQGANYTIEKLQNKKYVFKKYYPETRVMTQKVTFLSKDFQVKDGPYLERYDDGKIIQKGEYVKNIKQGTWEEYGSVGEYENGKRNGEWTYHDSKNRLKEIKNYKNGLLDGKQIQYDTLGAMKSESVYEMDKLIATTADTTAYENGEEIMPRFPGCEDLEGTDEAKKKCAEKKMLQYLYQNIKYPKKARKQEIEGMALVRFVIDKDGSITDIKVLRGLCDDIKEECYRIVGNMPQWTPGYQRGEPVRVQFNLPIRFNLK